MEEKIDKLISVSTAMDILGVSRSTLYKIKDLKVLRTNSNQRRYKMSDIQQIIKSWEQNGED